MIAGLRLTDRFRFLQAGNRETGHAEYRTTQERSVRWQGMDWLMADSPGHPTEYLQRQPSTAARTRPFQAQVLQAGHRESRQGMDWLVANSPSLRRIT